MDEALERLQALEKQIQRSAAARGGTLPPYLVGALANGGVVLAPAPDGGTVRGIGESARAAAQLLADVKRFGGPADRRTASRSVHEVLRTLSEPYRGWTGLQASGVVAAGSKVEDWSTGISAKVRSLPVGDFFGSWWTVARLGLTTVATFLLAFGNLQVAAVLLTVRILGSMLQPTPGMSADVLGGVDGGTGQSKRSDWHIDWRACAVGHFSDSLAMFGVSAYLTNSGHEAWGFGVGLVSVFQISATLLRVAAVQGGLVLRRLFLERVMRVIPLLVGLLLALVFQPSGPSAGVPLLALSAVGAAAYAILEVIRVIHASTTGQRVDSESSLDEMIWRRMANLVPVIERSAVADRLLSGVPKLEEKCDLAS